MNLTGFRIKAELRGPKSKVKFHFPLAISPDGRVIAVGAFDGSIWLWDIGDGRLKGVLRSHTDYILKLTFSRDGQMLASGSGDKTAKLWKVQTGGLVGTLTGHRDAVSSVSFSADGQILATLALGDRSPKFWDTRTTQLMTTLQNVEEFKIDGANNVAFAPNGQTVATTNFNNVYLWDAAAGTLKAKFVDEKLKPIPERYISHGRWENRTLTFSHADTIYRIAFAPDGGILATGSRDFRAKLWDVATGELRATLKHEGKVLALAFSRDGKTLATGSEDTTAKLWDVVTGQLKATLDHRGTVWSIDFRPDGKVVATSADNDHSVKIWDVATGKLLDELRDARYPVAFSPDGRTLATGGEKDSVLLWDVPL